MCAADGHTYEREVIEKWLVKNDTSPLTVSVASCKQKTVCCKQGARIRYMFQMQTSRRLLSAAMTLVCIDAKTLFWWCLCRVLRCHTSTWSPTWP